MKPPFNHIEWRHGHVSDRWDGKTAHASSCMSKEAFLTFDQADRVAAHRKRMARRKHSSAKTAKSDRAGLHPYRCRFCHHWHIGSRKK